METTKKEELARVQRVSDGKYNLINKQGKLLLNEWFKSVGCFYNGFAIVKRSNYEWNFINKQGKLLSNEWFTYADYFDKEGFARVQRKDELWNFINKDGKIISDEWFNSVEDFQ